MKYNKFIDHTNLKQNATKDDIKKLCEEAIEFDFMSVCINPWYVPYAYSLLKDSNVKVCTVIGFPLGSNTSDVKAFEAADAIKNGATEIDMVLNVSALKNKDYDFVLSDIKKVREATKGYILKVILETCLLDNEEIVKACELCIEAGADFVKTSTGFSTGGATIEAVKIMRKTVGDKLGVKASGGIRDRETMLNMIEAGANRIGTSSGTKII